MSINKGKAGGGFPYWWEVVLVGILVVECVLLRIYFPRMLSPRVFLGVTINFMEMGILSLAMAFVIISKNIDISVASIIALVSVTMASLSQYGYPLWVCIAAALVAGAAAGALNGVLVTRMRIPSLVVTLGTMSLYRGAAYVVTGDQTYSKYPPEFSFLGRGTIAGVPFPLLAFVVLFAVSWFVLHRSTFGRKTFAIGNNQTASLYSGIKVDRVLVAIFTLTGIYSAIAGVIMTSRNNSTRGNMAQGLELDVITAVVLGGVSMDGGKGNLIGVALAVFIIGIIRNGMYALNLSTELMKIIIGCLLILSLLLPRLSARIWKK
jgi:rhamnose transport system permease protein